MKINIKITKSKDIDTVAKVVLVNSKNEVLFLKRSNYSKKHAGDWDLPGGHLKSNESLLRGLKREVFEETKIHLVEAATLGIKDNLNFFFAKYNNEPIKISHEHTDYRFFTEEELDKDDLFQEVALKAIKINKNG